LLPEVAWLLFQASLACLHHAIKTFLKHLAQLVRIEINLIIHLQRLALTAKKGTSARVWM
jgi:hypothetical protein